MPEDFNYESAQPRATPPEQKPNPYFIPVAIIVAGLVVAAALFFGLRGQNKISNQTSISQSGETHEVTLGSNPALGSPEA